MRGPEVGRIVPYRSKERDAIHVAVAVVEAGEKLQPGQRVNLQDGVATLTHARYPLMVVGVVDPFLYRLVEPGERFWLFLLPNTVRAMRHTWSHPAFNDGNTEAMSHIRAIADGLDVDPMTLIERAREYLQNGDYWSEGGRFEGERIPDNFWDAYEAVTGETVPKDKRRTFLSCSC